MDASGLDLFMMCEALRRSAFTSPPPGYHCRLCRRDELAVWKNLCVPDPRFTFVLDDYFTQVYAPEGDLFFHRCTFLCDETDQPVGTCFLWKAYGRILTLHWLRVLPAYEGRGLGRALLSEVLRPAADAACPVFLHTHPANARAIHLYCDLGFRFLDAPAWIGYRPNGYQQGYAYLRDVMPPELFAALPSPRPAPPSLLEAAASTRYEQF